jgi:hypothetical protein
MATRGKLSGHIEGLLQYLSKPNEAANADLIRAYFRALYPEFVCESEAKNADGYVPGHFLLELKGKTDAWFAGLLQGLAYTRDLDFTLVIVAANEFLAVWDIKDIPKEILQDIHDTNIAPNAIGKKLATKYKDKQRAILKKAIWIGDDLFGLFGQDVEQVKLRIIRFEKTLLEARKVRQKIMTRNFTRILQQMVPFFTKKIKAVTAFYSMVYEWSENSQLQISHKYPDEATLNGASIKWLVPGKRLDFKEFVDRHYVALSENENVDDFFAQYDRALDTVDKDFRIKHGIFFTDLDLSKFVMWIVKQKMPNLGGDYFVIDPACGSGNLVTNWRSPLELRHKVVSEIEPELLFTVENRMKGDAWHNGKFTVVPKVKEGKGLNFLDKSADEYLDILKHYLAEKELEPDKPIAFLCNPPYRGDDDQSSTSIDYEIHPSIIEIIGKEAVAERYNCFLAQMKLICDKAPQHKIRLPSNSRMLVFTKSTWLTDRPSFKKVRNAIFSSFEFIDGILVNSREFFDVKGKFPVAFTIWEYNEKKLKLNPNRTVILNDLTWVKKKDLNSIPWSLHGEVASDSKLNSECNKIINNKKSILVSFGIERLPIKNWIDLKSKAFKRQKRKDEKNRIAVGGLPFSDQRTNNKCAYGEINGKCIGFMDNLTPCRIKYINDTIKGPWFRLNPQFMDVRKNRCFSGPPTHFGYYASNYIEAKKTFFWFSLGRIFSEMGYPMWADALEIWVPDIPSSLEKTVDKFIFSIGFSENECVETIFPVDNPIEGVPEIFINNPMAPTNPQSFWSTIMAPIFKDGDNSLPEQLVGSVNDLYEEWKKIFRNSPEIVAPYKKPYFIEQGFLKKTSGIIQIKDYAESVNNEILLKLYSRVRILLKETKQAFYDMLLDSHALNYFGHASDSKTNGALKNTIVKEDITSFVSGSEVKLKEMKAKEGSISTFKPESQFDHILEKRLALSGLIVDTLKNDPNLGRTKLAKLFYLADVDSNLNLETNYYREAAGPLDQRALYNNKIGIESLAEKYQYFSIKPKSGKGFLYVAGANIQDLKEKSISVLGEKFDKINNLINLCKKMNTEQAEILATLYACWNDILLDKRKCNDEMIIQEFVNSWHHKKRRFSKERLMKALSWMRKHNLIPCGKNKMTRTKTKDKIDDDLF